MRDKGHCLLSPKVITKGYSQKGNQKLKEHLESKVD